jgi:dolichol-phosphate mannosyltransferase
MKPSLLFVPCYNCAPQIVRLLKALPKDLAESADILLVDNQSRDNFAEATAQVVQSMPHFYIRTFRNNENYGLGGSFKNAFAAARTEGYKHLVLLHGDNQANPNDIHRLLTIAQKNSNFSAVLGARFMPGAQRKDFSMRRLLTNHALITFASVLAGKKIYELGSGLSVFKIDKFPADFIGRLPDHVAFDFQILLYLIETQSDFVFEPIEWKSEDEVTTISEFKVVCTLLGQMANWRMRGGKIGYESWPWIGARPWSQLN